MISSIPQLKVIDEELGFGFHKMKRFTPDLHTNVIAMPGQFGRHSEKGVCVRNTTSKETTPICTTPDCCAVVLFDIRLLD